jgi:hypothetical protein
MVSSLIEVFVRSRSKDVDVGHYREMSYHWVCGLDEWAYGELAAQFKGRILSEEDYEVMNQVFEMAKKENREVRIYDTSRLSDKARALKRGILKVPAIIMNGEQYQGLEQISHVLSRKPNL